MINTYDFQHLLRDFDIDPPSYLEKIINSVAQNYRDRSKEFRDSHRITGIIDELYDIESSANKLTSLIKQLHPQTFQAMGGDWRLPGQIPPHELEKIIRPSILAELDPENDSRGSDGFIKDITDLVALASETRKNLEGMWKFRRPDGKLDVGGNETIASMTSVHPKLELARSCYNILVPDLIESANASPNGLFYQFTALVYALASDEESEKRGVNLTNYVKRVISDRNDGS